MKTKFCLAYMMLSMTLVAWGVEAEFERLTGLYGKEYFDLREELLKKPELRTLLDELPNRRDVNNIKLVQGNILREWLENKDAIRNVMSSQVIKPTQKELGMRSGFHYPFWHSLPADKLDTLMKVYNANPCPWFILECLWKFNFDDYYRIYYDAELVTKPFEDLPKYTHHNPIYIFFGMARQMPEGQKKLFAGAFEYKIKPDLNNKTPEMPVYERLLYLGLPINMDIVIEVAMLLEPRSRALTIMQDIPMLINTKSFDMLQSERLKQCLAMLEETPEYGQVYKDYFKTLVDAVESRKLVDNDWIKGYVRMRCRQYPLAYYDHFIYSIRPDLKGKLSEERNAYGGFMSFNIAEEK